MRPQDLKRLIAGFLAFSIITSIVTLFSLNFIGTANPQQDALQVEGDNPLSTVSKNAFVEKLPTDGRTASGPSDGQSVYASDARDPSNLTQNLAGIFAKQVIDNNPDGAQPDQNGDPTMLKLPGEDKTAEMIKQALSKTAFTFDDQTSVSAGKILKSPSQEAVASYLKQVYGVLSQVSSSTKLFMAVNQSSTVDSLSLPSLAIDVAFEKLSSLSVPKPLVETHTALLRFFANQKNVFDAVSNYETDPMKTMLAVQNENEIINRDMAIVRSAADKVDINSLSLDNSPEWQKMYSEIFGVKKAYALFGVGDIVFDPSIFGEAVATVATLISNNLARIGEWAYTTALRIAVNTLINEFQNQVVNWIAGNGNPKFITNWNGFLQDVANRAAGQAIYDLVPQACSGFGPLLRVALLPVPYANTATRCTLTQVVSNVNAFYNRFKYGTWYQTWQAYGAAMQPSNNYFGQLIEFRDVQMANIANAQDAAKSQAVANKGFLPVTKCTKYALDENNNPTTTCEPGYEVATTPGAVVGETLTTSLGWKGNQIVSAQRFEDLVGAIVNASINRVIKEGLSSLTAAMNPPAPSFAGATPSNVANPAGLGSTSNNVATLINSMSQIGVFQENQNIINADTQWLALGIQGASSTLELLNQIVNSCSGQGQVATQRIGELNAIASTTIAELNAANSLNAAKALAQTATSTQDIMTVLNELQGVNINTITGVATAAQDRLASLQYFTTLVNASIANNDCGVGLPPPTVTPPPPPDQGGG